MAVTREAKQKEVDTNMKVFKELLPSIVEAHFGQFALMSGGKIIDYFTTFSDAEKAGSHIYSDSLYSVQKVNMFVATLGAFTYA